MKTVSLFSNSYQHCQREIVIGSLGNHAIDEKLKELARETEDGTINEVVENSLWSEIRLGMPSHMMDNYLSRYNDQNACPLPKSGNIMNHRNFCFRLRVILFLLSLTMNSATLPVCLTSAVAQPDNAVPDADVIKVLIMDGQNNHDTWPKTTWMMKQYLAETGLFSVDIARTRYTWTGKELIDQFPLDDGKTYEHLDQAKADPDFKPRFADYHVVINNLGYGAAPLPAETQKALVDFMRDGGGLVIVHAADNCWPEWKEYNQMIGLGGWGGRNEKSGPYVYHNDAGKLVVDNSPGNGGHHGTQHDFKIRVRESAHPIVAGLPSEFLHGRDELYEQLRGPAENMTIVASAFASPDQGGSNRHEPVLMTIKFGEGRVFHTVLGHADYSMESVAFITTLVRGTEWAATGRVTVEVPADFPGDEAVSSRKFSRKK